LSLDSLSEENPLETAQTETDEFALDDSFNLDLNSEETDELSLDSLSEETPLETAQTETDEFKLDDDFSDFDLSLNEEPLNNDLDLSLSDDEQVLLGDDVGSKFDLVETYIESNDIASAQSVLEDIVQSGTPEQQAQAQEILKELGV